MENIEFEPVMACADVKGSDKYPNINGRVIFKKKNDGVLVTAEILGLPSETDNCNYRIFAFHIHNGDSCTGNEKDSFSNAGTHFNPNNCEHPNHAGDLPPLFGNKGYAYMSVYTDRFCISDIIGKVIIIHDMPDDFKTQPSGGAGEKIACGKIIAL